MDLIKIATEFATEESCLAYLEKARWPEGVRCIASRDGQPCGSDRISRIVTKGGTRKNGRNIPVRRLFQCLDCGFQFTAKAGTLFNDSHLSLQKWFFATALMTNAKKGLSAKQLQRDLKVSYQTAWYLAHRIREAMESEEGVFGGTVEMDEFFHGGRFDARRHQYRNDKQPIMGIVQRGIAENHSKVVAFPIPNRGKAVVSEVVHEYIANDARIVTDEWSSYRQLKKTHNHAIVIHSRGEYVRGDVHTNSIEGFWSLFQRCVIGQHHFVSIKHLQRYLNQSAFSYNNRKVGNLFGVVIARLAIGVALPYAKLTSGPSASPRR